MDHPPPWHLGSCWSCLDGPSCTWVTRVCPGVTVCVMSAWVPLYCFYCLERDQRSSHPVSTTGRKDGRGRWIFQRLTVCASAKGRVSLKWFGHSLRNTVAHLLVLLGHIWMRDKGAAGWHHLPSLFTFHLRMLGVPSIRTDFCVFATARKMAVQMCSPLRNFSLWNLSNIGGDDCERALCRESDQRLPIQRSHPAWWLCKASAVVPIFRWRNRGSELCPKPQQWNQHFRKGLCNSEDYVLSTTQHCFPNETPDIQNISLMLLVFIYRPLIYQVKG